MVQFAYSIVRESIRPGETPVHSSGLEMEGTWSVEESVKKQSGDDDEQVMRQI